MDPQPVPERVPYGTTNGEEAIGVGAAALMFFNKPVWKLNLAQMSLLAGLPQSPSQYNPIVAPDLAKARRNNVLQAMVTSRYITQSLATAVEKQPLQVHPNQQFIQVNEPYIFDYVEQQLFQQFGANTVENGGLKVYTTIDPKVEQEALNAIHRPRGRLRPRRPAGGRAGRRSTRPTATSSRSHPRRPISRPSSTSRSRPSGRRARRSRRSR